MTSSSEVSRTLYRSLLRWARDPRVRDAFFEVEVPRVAAAFVPWLVEQGSTLRCGSEALAAIREGFRRGNDLDAAFEAVRAANDANEELDAVWQRREACASGDAVFRVGDVVRHKIDGYRCVVASWDDRPIMDVSRWSNVLRTKRKDAQPFYRVLPDARDAVASLGRAPEAMYCAEDELQRTDHVGVVHRAINGIFRDWKDGRFVPAPHVAFKYGEDACVDSSEDLESSSIGSLARKVASALDGVEAVREFVQWDDQRAKHDGWQPRSAYSACGRLVKLVDGLDSLVLTRMQDGAPFELGAHVRHRVFDYSAVVVGFDLRPIVDVRDWEAVKLSARGHRQPFVHVIADADDTRRVFGAPRGFRYVAASNLEALDREARSPSSSELDDLPWPKLEFQYGNVSSDIERAIVDGRRTLVAALPSLLDESLDLLARAKFHEEAFVAERLVDFILSAHPDDNAKLVVYQAVTAAKTDIEDALHIFDNAISLHPTWAEPYYRASLALFEALRYDDAADRAQRALDLEPKHILAKQILGVCMARRARPDLRAAMGHLDAVNRAHPFSDSNFELHKTHRALWLAGDSSASSSSSSSVS